MPLPGYISVNSANGVEVAPFLEPALDADPRVVGVDELATLRTLV